MFKPNTYLHCSPANHDVLYFSVRTLRKQQSKPLIFFWIFFSTSITCVGAHALVTCCCKDYGKEVKSRKICWTHKSVDHRSQTNTVGSLIGRHANDSPSICLKRITEKITLTPSQKWPSLFWVTSTKASMRTGKDSLLADFVNFQVNARKKFASTLKAGMVTSLVYATDVISVKRPTNVTRIWDLMFQPLISMFGHITSPDSP